MNPFRISILSALLLAGTALPRSVGAMPGSGSGIPWVEWSDGVFETARRDGRLVLLDLGAVWCHWCHVMEETTYRDPEVVRLLQRHFVTVRVDQDARPDLSNRYEDYGWPATIVFDARGTELVKFSGYIAPRRMQALLEAVVRDPTPGPSARPEPAAASGPADSTLPAPLRQELESLLVQRYDREKQGWGFSKKFLDWDAVEHGLERSRVGDAGAGRMARETLSSARRLIDPVWGGLYQYSDSGDWDHPHYEKLIQFQAEGIRVYAQAYALWGDRADLAAARDIHRYVRAFLRSPEGGFYVSQDADLVRGEHAGAYFALDDAGRRARGLPRVDTHVYARETSWMVPALVWLYAVTGDPEILAEARTAARFVVEKRARPGGGFRHDAADAAGPYLGDTLAAGRAFLALWGATGDRAWLSRAEQAADFVAKTFPSADGRGLVSAVSASRFAPPRRQRDENVAAARFANLLFHYTGREADRRLAARAMRFLVQPDVARKFSTASVLLADAEQSGEPAHLTVVGPRDEPEAVALLAAALSEPTAFKRVEILDRREGPLPNLDVEFPDLGRPAAFACANGRCSLPAFTGEELRKRAARLRPAA